MKHTFTFVTLLLYFTLSTQTVKASEVHLSYGNHGFGELFVEVNGFSHRMIGNEIFISNIRTGRQFVTIYEVFRNRRGVARRQIVYQGEFFVPVQSSVRVGIGPRGYMHTYQVTPFQRQRAGASCNSTPNRPHHYDKPHNQRSASQRPPRPIPPRGRW